MISKIETEARKAAALLKKLGKSAPGVHSPAKDKEAPKAPKPEVDETAPKKSRVRGPPINFDEGIILVYCNGKRS